MNVIEILGCVVFEQKSNERGSIGRWIVHKALIFGIGTWIGDLKARLNESVICTANEVKARLGEVDRTDVGKIVAKSRVVSIHTWPLGDS